MFMKLAYSFECLRLFVVTYFEAKKDMLLCIEFSPFLPIIRPSVCQSVYMQLTVSLHSALCFRICFCFLESSTGTCSFALCTTIRLMLLIRGQCLRALES